MPNKYGTGKGPTPAKSTLGREMEKFGKAVQEESGRQDADAEGATRLESAESRNAKARRIQAGVIRVTPKGVSPSNPNYKANTKWDALQAARDNRPKPPPPSAADKTREEKTAKYAKGRKGGKSA